MSDSHATAVQDAEHHPALQHHFADMQQQKNAASLGMWLFLVTEIMFFGGMFCAYLVYRLAHFNAFAAASQQLSIKMVACNTAILIISSVTVVLAVKAAESTSRSRFTCRSRSKVVSRLTDLGSERITTGRSSPPCAR